MDIWVGNNVSGHFSRWRPKDKSRKDMVNINIKYNFIVSAGCVHEVKPE